VIFNQDYNYCTICKNYLYILFKKVKLIKLVLTKFTFLTNLGRWLHAILELHLQEEL